MMRGMDLFCCSPASTAVISSTHVHRSTVRHTHKGYGPFARVPCSSLFPSDPKPSYEKHRKSCADKENINDDLRRKSCVELNGLYTHRSPGSSTRHLLSDPPFVPTDDSPASSARSGRNQVVALRVSLHCKGCAAKVRKHISKMEGVTSFSMDMETKKVTITGDVTPLGVLASVSRVKNAQLWPSSSSMPMAMEHVMSPTLESLT